MKKINTTLTIISLVLLCTLVSFVGCSDMMATLGNISLTIDLDTPEVEVASYILEGNLVDSNSRFTLNNIVPPRHTLSELKQGRWNLTVKAFDDQGNQIGIGTKTVDLKAGQVVETSLLVEFGQSTPVLSTFTIAGPSRYDDREGSVAGTTTRMEYRLASAAADDPFTACTAGSTLLAPGSYKIRYAAAHGLQASECLTISVPAYTPIQLTITSPTLTTTKEYDGTNTVQGSITPGTLSGILSGDEVTVHAQAVYDASSVGNSRTITITYSLGGADANNYLKPTDSTSQGTITQKQLTISGTTVTASKEYDRLLEAMVTQTGTLAGKVGNEDVTVSASASYQDKNAGTGKQITVVYTLGGANEANYLKPADNTSFSGAITRKALSITGTPVLQTRDYDGGRTAQVTNPGSLSGVLAGDSVSLQATALYADKSVADNKSATVSYTISGDDALNYTAPSDASGRGSIRPKQLVVTGYNLTTTKQYDGNNSAAISSVAFDGKVLSETVQVIPEATYSSAGIGNKTITITYSLGGADANNYLKPTDSTSQGTITQKQLTISGTTVAASKEYDRLLEAMVTQTGTLAGKVGNEDVTVSASASYQDKNAGTGKQITVVYTLGGANEANYLKPADNTSFSGAITRKALSIIGTPVLQARDYDGGRTAQVTNPGSLAGVIAGDSVSLQATAIYDNKTVGNGKSATVSYSISGADALNYTAPSDASGTGDIRPKQLTVTDFNLVSTKEYDGSASSTINNVACSGMVSTDDVQVSANATYNSPTAGTNKPITVTYTLAGDDSGNYLKPADSIATATGEITRKQLRVTGTTPTLSKVYDGTTNLPITSNGTLQGVIQGEDVTLSTAAGAYASADAGTSKAFTIRYTLSGTDATNYTVNDTTGTTGIINKAVLTATVGDYTKSYGTTNPTFTVSVSGFVNGESASTASGYNAPIASSTATTTTSAGTNSTITISGGSATNYSFNTSTGTLTINKAAISNDLAIFGGTSPKYGDVLTAIGNATLLGTPTYQWNRGGTAISGATAKTYTLTAADVGSIITVTAIADGINYEGSHTSRPTNTVSRIDGPSIDGAFSAYYPSSPATQTIINLTGFTPNLSGLEARVSLNGIQYDDYADLEIDSRGRAMILMSSSVTTSAKVQVRYKETATTDAGAVREIPITEQALAIGDYYAGGVVGYIYQSSDPGYVANELHGLIAAKTDTTPSSMVWSSRDLEVGGTSTALGTGAANTTRIIDYFNSLGNEPTPYAAQAARDYTDGTYHDWFLPSFEELFKIRTNKAIIGNFQDSSVYWTSSESTQEPDPHDYGPTKCAHVLPFSTTSGTGWVNYKSPRNSSYTADEHVRPVRYF